MRCLQAKPYKYRCNSCQAAVTSKIANRLFHVLGKDYYLLHTITWLHNSTLESSKLTFLSLKMFLLL